MCGTKRRPTNQFGESYEGQTTRLNTETQNGVCRSAWRGFPWWTLWLIWPLIGLLKGAGSALTTGWLMLGTLAVPLNIVLAIVLITVGVALLLRQRPH